MSKYRKATIEARRALSLKSNFIFIDLTKRKGLLKPNAWVAQEIRSFSEDFALWRVGNTDPELEA